MFGWRQMWDAAEEAARQEQLAYIRMKEAMENIEIFRIERMKHHVKVIAHFDDGYYTINDSAWIKCDKEGNINQEKSKMTREEAERKLYSHQWGTEKRKEFLDGLEVLGILKFEEAPGPDCRTLIFSSQSPLAYQVIIQLERLGYKVDKPT